MRPQSVDKYIVSAPKEIQEKLTKLRKVIKEAAPNAEEEKISYSIPYYGYKGRLAYFRYATHHIGLYVMPPVIEEHKDDLKGYVTAKSAVQFPFDKPLPISLIKKLVKTGVKQNDEAAKKK